jgi:hypothetical protein
VWAYVTVTVTESVSVTVTPPTVTILQQDPNAVASSIAFIDGQQISALVIEEQPQDGALRPYTFTDVIRVSGFEATEIAYTSGGSVYYLPIPATGTDTPSASITLWSRTTTITPYTPSFHQQEAHVNTSTTLSTDSSSLGALTLPESGWNGSTSVGSSLSGPVTAVNGSAPPGTGIYPYFPPVTSATDVLPTFTQPASTSTVTEIATVYATFPPEGIHGYDTTVYSDGTSSPASADLEKRQTCVWISAVIGGQTVGWCNNWAGLSTLTYNSWVTTGKFTRRPFPCRCSPIISFSQLYPGYWSHHPLEQLFQSFCDPTDNSTDPDNDYLRRDGSF